MHFDLGLFGLVCAALGRSGPRLLVRDDERGREKVGVLVKCGKYWNLTLLCNRLTNITTPQRSKIHLSRRVITVFSGSHQWECTDFFLGVWDLYHCYNLSIFIISFSPLTSKVMIKIRVFFYIVFWLQNK